MIFSGGPFTLQWRHNGHNSVSNHQPHDYLLNRLFRRRSKKTLKLRVTGLCAGNSPGPVNSPHKWPVTRKMFPFDDVIMTTFNRSLISPAWTFWVSIESLSRILVRILLIPYCVSSMTSSPMEFFLRIENLPEWLLYIQKQRRCRRYVQLPPHFCHWTHSKNCGATSAISACYLSWRALFYHAGPVSIAERSFHAN